MKSVFIEVSVHYLLLWAITHWGVSAATSANCAARETKYGSVCVCTADYCDYLEEPNPSGTHDFAVVSSSKEGLRFSVTNGRFGAAETVRIATVTSGRRSIENATDFEHGALLLDANNKFVQFIGLDARSYATDGQVSKTVQLHVDRSTTYQSIEGFGGAFTGAVSHILQQLDAKLQDHIYRSFYHKDGIGFNMLRMPIAGCDFDLEPWAYNEHPRNDPHLTNFTALHPRDELKVQQINRLKAVAGLEHIKIMAAAWSSPTWMKSNEAWTGFSYLKPEYYQTWANYHLRFLELMDAKNMPIWAISTGNEPLNGVIGWLFVRFMSLGWTPSNQAIWLSTSLGPTIRNSKYKNVLIFGNDDQRYTYPAWFKAMKSSRSDALDYLDGLAVHWYWDDVFAPNLIDAAHAAMPDKLLINTESCVGDKPWQTHGPELGSWERGEQYVRAFMQDLQHAFNGWIDWNLVLDEHGGPNYVSNHVDAPVIVNSSTQTEFYKQPIFYAIGHFSKFIAAGSVRIATHLGSIDVEAVGFKRPDGRIVVVLFNSAHAAVDVALSDSLRGSIVINMPARSLHTVVYN